MLMRRPTALDRRDPTNQHECSPAARAHLRATFGHDGSLLWRVVGVSAVSAIPFAVLYSIEFCPWCGSSLPTGWLRRVALRVMR
jgi:hypothetical protein